MLIHIFDTAIFSKYATSEKIFTKICVSCTWVQYLKHCKLWLRCKKKTYNAFLVCKRNYKIMKYMWYFVKEIKKCISYNLQLLYKPLCLVKSPLIYRNVSSDDTNISKDMFQSEVILWSAFSSGEQSKRPREYPCFKFLVPF